MHEKFHYKSLEEIRQRAAELGEWLPLEEAVSILTSPMRLGDWTLPNRIALQPMEGTDGTEDGAPGPLTIRRYHRFAKGGAALIWFEAVATAPEVRASAHQLYLTPDNLDDFKRLVGEIKEIGLKENGFAPIVIMQATNSGRYSKPHGYPEPIIAYNNPIFEGDSPIPAERIVTDDQLRRYEEKYTLTARLAQQAGFDGIDIKCCHRYLACELLSAYTRPGEYGGSFENRTRFLRNCYRAAMAGVTGKYVFSSRLNAYDGFPYPYGFGVEEGGGLVPKIDEAVELVGLLQKEFGIPFIDITIGNPYKNPHVNRPYDVGNYVPDEHPFTGLSRMMRCVSTIQKAHPDLPVIGSAFSYLRQYSANLAAGMLAGGHAAMAGFGRMAFANPDFPNQLKEHGAIDAAKVCLTCGNCAQLLRAGIPAGCVIRDRESYSMEALKK